MKVKIRKTLSIEHDVNFDFPIYRRNTIDEDHEEFWKFDSINKVTKIVDKGSEMSILTYTDPNTDFIEAYMNSDFLYGRHQYDIISEKVFDMALDRLINLIHRS